MLGSRPAGNPAGNLTLWNQKGADTGAFLFAGKARSYSALYEAAMRATLPVAGMARSHSMVRSYRVVP